MIMQRHHFGFFMIVLCVFLVLVFAGMWEVFGRLQFSSQQPEDPRSSYCDPNPCD